MAREIKFSLVYRDMWQSSGKYVPRVDQLCEVMPELENVQAWPEVGQSHEARSLGVTATRRFEPDVERRLTE